MGEGRVGVDMQKNLCSNSFDFGLYFMDKYF